MNTWIKFCFLQKLIKAPKVVMTKEVAAIAQAVDDDDPQAMNEQFRDFDPTSTKWRYGGP